MILVSFINMELFQVYNCEPFSMVSRLTSHVPTAANAMSSILILSVNLVDYSLLNFFLCFFLFLASHLLL
ncbi:hypothetical protein DSCW_53780 [Desulfosarcina widdelii]|uniref:Uncharacterized protein n=1 Tax=Desulfosarcina widdelii TaxID=947919 RepID=A0A5K7ZE01_9BACT|nr:hypothetical protein DSCW_53780 [Desulfosarcina widdelii]